MENAPVSLVDGDYARRARIAHALSAAGRHVEPFESLEEFAAKSHDRSVLLVHDEGTLVRDVINWCQREGHLIGALVYAQDPAPKSVVTAIRHGATDYCQWPIDPESLQEAVNACQAMAESEWTRIEKQAFARKLIERLTPREKEVLGYMTKGLSNRAIGEKLGISPRTVEIHRGHMLSKLYASNSPDAVRIALEAGIEL